MEEAMFKVERMEEIKSVIKPLNKIFDVATNGQLKIQLNTNSEMIQFFNSENHLLYELSYKNKSALGFVKTVMDQI